MAKEVYKPGEILGWGVEKGVYVDKEDPNKAIGLYHAERKPEYLKAQFYLGKLLHILYPDNFPEMFLMTSEPSGLKRKKVELKKGTAMEDLSESYVGEIQSFYKTIEKELGIRLDNYEANFGRDPNGHLIYLDTIKPWKWGFEDAGEDFKNYNSGLIRKAIEKIEDEAKKREAFNCLERLNKMCEEQLEKWRKRRRL